MPNHSSRLFAWVALLSFGSGFPLLFSSEILKAYVVTSGLELYYVSLLGMLILPYMLSWIWAPVIDYWTNSSLIGHGKLISVMFLLIGCCIHLLAVIDVKVDFYALLLSSLMLAILCATQDHLIEKYRRVLLPSQSWVRAMGYSIFAFRLAILISGGLGLVFADLLGWQRLFQGAAIIMYCFALFALLLPKLTYHQHNSLSAQYQKSYQAGLLLFQDRSKLLFLLIYRLGFFWLEAMAIVYLLNQINMGLAEVGMTLKVLGVMGVAIGAYVARQELGHRSVSQVLMLTTFAQQLLLFLFYMCSTVGMDKITAVLLLMLGCALQGAMGLVSGVWFMQESEADLASFNFSLWYGVSVSGRLIVAPITYFVVAKYGWSSYFLTGVIVGFFSVVTTCCLMPKGATKMELKLSQTS
ncbi:hypothetical protein OAT84_01390 [Gammaproteobacteria bacterium]|nr:hypothetical protein [Gammaproteobacteria bacterium]